MKVKIYCFLLGFFVVLGMVCAFAANIPSFYLADSFGAVGLCCFALIVFALFFMMDTLS